MEENAAVLACREVEVLSHQMALQAECQGQLGTTGCQAGKMANGPFLSTEGTCRGQGEKDDPACISQMAVLLIQA